VLPSDEWPLLLPVFSSVKHAPPVAAVLIETDIPMASENPLAMARPSPLPLD
jgi:hypothetical protein